jgi:penicillin-binding protein 1A
MVNMMKDVVVRGTAARIWSSGFKVPAGGKTGTTNDGADVWFIGYTSDIVAGVWMGFDRPQKIKSNAQGGVLAAPVWTAFMNSVYAKRPAPRDWEMPPNIVSVDIDATTNMLATPYCPPEFVRREYYIRGTDPIAPCDVHTAAVIVPDTSGLYHPDSIRPLFPPLPPTDTSRRPRDSAIFPLVPRDSLRLPDSLRVRPRPIPPDSGRVP